jgi:hypothetical protein
MSSAVSSLRRHPLIFVVETAQNRPSDDLGGRWWIRANGRSRGRLKTECAMRPGTALVPLLPLRHPDHTDDMARSADGCGRAPDSEAGVFSDSSQPLGPRTLCGDGRVNASDAILGPHR